MNNNEEYSYDMRGKDEEGWSAEDRTLRGIAVCPARVPYVRAQWRDETNPYSPLGHNDILLRPFHPCSSLFYCTLYYYTSQGVLFNYRNIWSSLNYSLITIILSNDNNLNTFLSSL